MDEVQSWYKTCASLEDHIRSRPSIAKNEDAIALGSFAVCRLISCRYLIRMAWKDAAKIYLIEVTLLVFGALWQMTGLFFVLRWT
jgi:hypothetical protein